MVYSCVIAMHPPSCLMQPFHMLLQELSTHPILTNMVDIYCELNLLIQMKEVLQRGMLFLAVLT